MGRGDSPSVMVYSSIGSGAIDSQAPDEKGNNKIVPNKNMLFHLNKEVRTVSKACIVSIKISNRKILSPEDHQKLMLYGKRGLKRPMEVMLKE